MLFKMRYMLIFRGGGAFVHLLSTWTGVMVLLGLSGDVHKVNCTWNLKAIDEFQSLLIFAGQIESRFSFQSTEFHKSR